MRKTNYVIIPIKDLTDEVIVLAQKMWDSQYTPIVLYTNNPNKVNTNNLTVLKKTGKTFNAWINQGIEYAYSLNKNAKCVSFNSDMDIELNALDEMFELLKTNDLVGLKGWEHLTGGVSPLRGHCFGIKASSGLRLPQKNGYALWWWQTDHLYYTAVAENKSVAFADVKYTHQSDNEYSKGWKYPEEFAWSAQKDHDWYWKQHWQKDPTHSSCYWNNWPHSIPEGQTHKTQWNPELKTLKAIKGEMKIAGNVYPIIKAKQLLSGAELYWKWDTDLNNLKPRNPSLTFGPDGQLHCLLPAAKYAIKPTTTPEASESHLELQTGENEWNTRIYYVNLSEGHTEPVEITYDNHECYDPRLFYDNSTKQYKALLHNHISKKQMIYVVDIENKTMTYDSKLNIHKRGQGLREKNWMRLPYNKGYIVHWDTITNLSSGVFSKINNNIKYADTRGGGNVYPININGKEVYVAITHKTIKREGKLPIYTNQFTYYNPQTLKIVAQTPDFKFSNHIVEFTSGLAIDDTYAYVGYGVSDWWAEVTRIPIETIKQLYVTYKDE